MIVAPAIAGIKGISMDTVMTNTQRRWIHVYLSLIDGLLLLKSNLHELLAEIL
jgi:hypothetical protein